jgi:hypothetical protein
LEERSYGPIAAYFVEGIMGSGNSTIGRWLARLYRRSGIPAQPVPGARPHPTNVFRSLPQQRWFYKLYDYLFDIR